MRRSARSTRRRPHNYQSLYKSAEKAHGFSRAEYVKKKATTYMTINRNKNIAAVMNRALCELDPEAENLFRKTDETPKEFFNDTDEYATSGFHNKPLTSSHE